MSRPAITGLFDTTVEIWRPTRTPGAQYRQDVVTYALVGALPTGPNAAVNRPRAPIADAGPGLADIGERVIYLAGDADVLERDVLLLVGGPDAPGRWEVNGPPTRPRGHHTELRCFAWHGQLPGD